MAMSILDRFKLDGRIALVTGGAGLYGKQITEALAEAGARTFLASRNLEQSERLAHKLRVRKLQVAAKHLDLAEQSSIARLKDAIVQEAGRVDILVNNAVLRPMADWSGTADQFTQSMLVNATGLFLMTRTFGEAMAQQGSGSISTSGRSKEQWDRTSGCTKGWPGKRLPTTSFIRPGW